MRALIAIACAAILAACASDQTAKAIRDNEQSMSSAQSELRYVESMAAQSSTPEARARWEAEAASIRQEIADRFQARSVLIQEHDAADASDAQAWTDTWGTVGGLAAGLGIPGAAGIAAIVGNLRGRKSGAQILATAIARARRIDPAFDAVFRNDASPAVAMLKGATPSQFVPVIQAANESAKA